MDATKSGFAKGKGLLAGGDGGRHMHASLDESLRRLQTDYVAFLWPHAWNSITPAEELPETMATLVRFGKICYWGLSNSPAFYVAKRATLATVRDRSRVVFLFARKP